MQFPVHNNCSCVHSHALTTSRADWWLAERIATGDPRAMEELYTLLNQSLRAYIQYRLPEQEPDDVLHETLTVVLEAVRKGELRNPEALQAYVQVIARRLIAGKILRAIWLRKRMVDPASAFSIARSADDPEQEVLHKERRDLIHRGLSQLQARDSELLTRFYLRGESFPQICREMQLTETQFRLFKSRAKAKLTAWARAQQCEVRAVAGEFHKAPPRFTHTVVT